eukprot:6208308-Pleurochrysis_carterae.AAC.2
MHASRGGVTQGDAVGSEFNYVVRNQPLPLTAEQELQASRSRRRPKRCGHIPTRILHPSSKRDARTQTHTQIRYTRTSTRTRPCTRAHVLTHVHARSHAHTHTHPSLPQARLVLAFLAGLFVIIPFCFIPATVAAFVVKERVCKAKHLQLVSGTKVSVYWLATYLWDVGMFLLVTVGIMLVFLAYNEPAFVGSTEQVSRVIVV